MKQKREEAVASWEQFGFPAQIVVARVRSNKLGAPDVTTVASKNPDHSGMLVTTVRCEVVAPDKIKHGDIDVQVAGAMFNLIMCWNPKQSWGTAACYELLKKLGWPDDQSFDPEVESETSDIAFFQDLCFLITAAAVQTFKATDGKSYVATGRLPAGVSLLNPPIKDRFRIEADARNVLRRHELGQAY